MLSVIIPVYNEEDVVEKTIIDVANVLVESNVEFEIIVVDDGSTDKTSKKLSVFNGEYFFPKIKLIKNPYNLGYGASIKKGLKSAIYNKILIIDSDGSYPVDSIPDLLKYSNDFDMVVGSRSLNSEGQEFIKKYPKMFLNFLANILSPVKIEDLNSGLRIFDKEKALEFMDLYPEGFSFTSTITLAFVTHSYTVKYVPINYYKRVGKSKMKARYFVDFLSLFLRIILNFKPLKFFVPLGVFLILFGVVFGVWHLFTSVGVGTVSAISILSGLQVILLGFVMEVRRR